MAGVVTIDCFHDHLSEPDPEAAIVAVDVIRSTTTAVTAVAAGRRCFPVPSIEAAVPLAARLKNPLLAGELGGSLPYGFHVQNSPAEVEQRTDSERPIILLSTSGTRLMCEAAMGGVAYAGCLRNVTAQAAHIDGRHDRVRLLGADSRGDFRDEDQLCAAWIAARLVDAGYTAGDELTERLLDRWVDAPLETLRDGRSAKYLLDTDQGQDLDFVLSHVDDLRDVFAVSNGEVLIQSRG